MEGQRWWYYLNQSRQVGPFSQSELRLLLAKEVVSPATLVWARGSGKWRALGELSGEAVINTSNMRIDWMVAALAATIFFGVTMFVLTWPTWIESLDACVPLLKEEMTEKLGRVTQERRRMQSGEIAKSGSGRTEGLVDDWSHSSFDARVNPTSLSAQASSKNRAPLSTKRQLAQKFWPTTAYSHIGESHEATQVRKQMQIVDKLEPGSSANLIDERSRLPFGASVMFNSIPVFARASPAPRGALPERRLVQEFWRSFVYSQVVERYEYYLHRYPTGGFADIATARINELRKVSLQEMNKGNGGTADKKGTASFTEIGRPQKLAKDANAGREARTNSSETRTPKRLVKSASPEKRPSASSPETRRPKKLVRDGTPRKKIGANSSQIRPREKSVETTSIPGKVLIKKSEGRCWGRYIEHCRERCREGDARACQKLDRLGG